MQIRTILTSIPLLAAAWLGSGASAQTAAPAAPASAAASRADATILEMNQAFRRGDRRRLAQLLPSVRGHALEPWAAYWELRARLDEAGAQEVEAFFARYAGTYQEDRLRNDWLLLLGQRRDWLPFAEQVGKFRMNDDREVRCYAVLVGHVSGSAPATPALAAQVRRDWYALRDADDGCTQAADRLLAARLLTPADVWRKARLAAEANRPRAVRNAVALVAPEALNQVGELMDSPARFLAARVTAASSLRKELVLLALIRMAANDADMAAAQLENKWGVQLTPEERNWAWGTIGRQFASRLSPAALDHYAKVGKDADLSDDMLAWKARAALRLGRWKDVLAATRAMSDEGRADPAWVYWRARAQAALSRPESEQRAESVRLFESIAGVRGFYEQLALEELGGRTTVPARPAPLTAEEKEAARLNPGLNRALLAILIGLRPEGVREWNYTTNLHTSGGMGERELLAAADFACAREVWDRCINTSERTAAFDVEQRFPMPFRDAVVQRSRDIGLDPAYVYGLIRQESRFIMDARSHVGASGLMQLMPATARWTARKLGMSDFSAAQVNERDVNIALGTGYLKLVLDDFAGSLPLAAAAYNAGPGRPRSWRNGPVMEAAAWAENVPFSETRDYVKKVLSNTTVYAAVLSGQPQSLKARLGRVGPRDAAAPEVNKDLP